MANPFNVEYQHINTHFYADRIAGGTGSSPNAIQGGAWSQQPNVVNNQNFWVRSRPDLGISNNKSMAAEARTLTPEDGYETRLQYDAGNIPLLKQIFSQFKEDAWRVLRDAMDANRVQMDVGSRDDLAFRIILGVTGVGTMGVETDFFPRSAWVPWSLVEDAGASMLRLPGVVKITKGVSEVPTQAQHLSMDTATIYDIPGSNITLLQIHWVSLLAYDIHGFMLGNGVPVVQYQRTCLAMDDLFSKSISDDTGIEIDFHQGKDCLFTTLAFARKVWDCLRHHSEDKSSTAAVRKVLTTLLDAELLHSQGQQMKNWFIAQNYNTPDHIGSLDMLKHFASDHPCLSKARIMVLESNFTPIMVLNQHCKIEVLIMYHADEKHYTPVIPFELFRNVRPANLSAEVQKLREAIMTMSRHAKKKGNLYHCKTPENMLDIGFRLSRLVPTLLRPWLPESVYDNNKMTDPLAEPAAVTNSPGNDDDEEGDQGKVQATCSILYMDMETEQRVTPNEGLDGETTSLLDSGTYEQLPIMVGWYMANQDVTYEEWYPCEKDDVMITEGYDCVHQFIKWLDEAEKSDVHKLKIYAHNGGKFDHILMLRALKEYPSNIRFRITKLLPRGSGFLTIEIKRLRDGAKIELRDTLHHLTGSLDRLCKDFKPPHYKLTGTVDYDSLNKALLATEEGEQWRDYLRADVLSLCQIFQNYNRAVRQSYDISATDCLTSATLAKKVFTFHYYNLKKWPLSTLGSECEMFVRESYHGGRCEVFKHFHDTSPVYYYDFTSMYPYVMLKDLPYGTPHPNHFNIKTLARADNPHLCFVEVLVKTDKAHKNYGRYPPYIATNARQEESCLSGSTKLIFGDLDDYVRVVLFSDDIRYIFESEQPYLFKPTTDHPRGFYKGWYFKKAPFLKEFTEKLFEKKRTATNKTDRQVAKITVNSGYGFWGMRRTRAAMQVYSLTDKKEADALHSAFKRGLFTHMHVMGGVAITKTLEMADSSTIIPSISSAITSYARTMLHELLCDIVNQGGELLYCDTDSVITTLKFEDNLFFQKKMGTWLGGLTNELEDWPNQRGESFVAVAPKMYAIRGSDALYETQAHKGFSKMRYEHMKSLWFTKQNYEETQLQFKLDQRSIYNLYTPDASSSVTDSDMGRVPISLQRTNVRKIVSHEQAQRNVKRRINEDNTNTRALIVKTDPFDSKKFVYV